MQATRAILEAKESVEDEIMKRPGVTGVGVGPKYVKGARTDRVSIQVFVAKKKSVPKGQAIPEEIAGHPTDVIERTFKPHPAAMKVLELQPMSDTGTYNPVKGGISIGPCRSIGGYVFAGTLGAVVRDNATGNPLLLSNFHVLCVDSGWAVGNTMVQPSRVDTGVCPGGVVGTLLRAQLTSAVDAAVCTLSGRGHSCEIVDIGTVTGTAVAALAVAVRKRGRTTGLTYGTIDSVSLSVSIDYGDGIGVKILTNQIGITPDLARNPMFGDHGDSGSVVVNAARKVLGLYFAGSDDGYGVANPIAAVLAALNVSMCVGKSFLKELKDGKNEFKEFKNEKIEIKELKREKVEFKEFLKERKPEKIEYEKLKRVPDFLDPKAIREGDPFQPPIEDPFKPPVRGPIGGGGMDERLARLEEAVGRLSTFIGGDLRPDLGAGALSQEPDLGGTAEELQQRAEEAASAKAEFDAAQA